MSDDKSVCHAAASQSAIILAAWSFGLAGPSYNSSGSGESRLSDGLDGDGPGYTYNLEVFDFLPQAWGGRLLAISQDLRNGCHKLQENAAQLQT